MFSGWNRIASLCGRGEETDCRSCSDSLWRGKLPAFWLLPLSLLNTHLAVRWVIIIHCLIGCLWIMSVTPLPVRSGPLHMIAQNLLMWLSCHVIFVCYYFAPGRVGKVLWCLCLSVCLSVCLSMSISPELHIRSSPIFYACYLCPWLGPPLLALRYVMYLWMMSYLHIMGHMHGACVTLEQPASQPGWSSMV